MAHYDCSCCGESFGISHKYCERCQSGECHQSKTERMAEWIYNNFKARGRSWQKAPEETKEYYRKKAESYFSLEKNSGKQMKQEI